MNSGKPQIVKHPLIQHYITSNASLCDIAKADSTLLGGALRQICDCLAGRQLAREALEAAEALDLTQEEPHAVILLLSQWARLCTALGNQSEAHALLHQASELTASGTHPGVTAARLSAEAEVAGSGNNAALREQHLRAALAILPEASPRRPEHLYELLTLLCRQGRGAHSASLMRELEHHAGHTLPRWHSDLLRFIDAVESGRAGPAATLSAQLAADIPPAAMGSSSYGSYHSLLELMQRTAHAPLIQAPPFPRPSQPTWLHVPYLLLRRSPREALKAAREDAQRSASPQLSDGFAGFNLIRAELACGNTDAAQRLIQKRIEQGSAHYLDDLYLTLINHRRGRIQAARGHFTRTLHLIERHQAAGRLDFELAMLPGLTPSAMARLLASSAPRTETTEEPEPETKPRPTSVSPVHQRGIERITGRSSAIQSVRRNIRQYAGFDAPILITGETGTGKEVAARALHEESQRAGRPFVAVNCGALPEALLESELFGHAKGAFTGADRAALGLFAEADEGTILLDEIGEIPPRLQAVLLRVLESGEFRSIGSTKNQRISCRVLAATNADLHARVGSGQFRQDLLYRLERLRIHMPPLRERTPDIMLLGRRFLDEGRPKGVHARVSRRFVETVRGYDWPGNVRELRNVVERMRLTHSDKLDYGDDDLDIKLHAPLHPEAGSLPERISLPLTSRGPEPPSTPARRAPHTPALPAEATPPSPPPPPPEASRTPLRRRQRLLEYFRIHRILTRGEVVRLLAISPNTASADLKALCQTKQIRRVTPSASTRSHYFELND